MISQVPHNANGTNEGVNFSPGRPRASIRRAAFRTSAPPRISSAGRSCSAICGNTGSTSPGPSRADGRDERLYRRRHGRRSLHDPQRRPLSPSPRISKRSSSSTTEISTPIPRASWTGSRIGTPPGPGPRSAGSARSGSRFSAERRLPSPPSARTPEPRPASTSGRPWPIPPPLRPTTGASGSSWSPWPTSETLP